MADKETALISVVIPCYNGEAFIRESIDSVLNQSYANVEIVVVDDGSTDSSAQILADYGEQIRVVSQKNAGLPAARNAGIRVATGDFFAFLDADDYLGRDFLMKTHAAIETAQAGIAYCGWQNVGIEGGGGEPFVPPDYEADPEKEIKLILGVRWPVHGALVRRSVLEQVGGFNPLMESCEDFAFWIRAATTNKLVRVPEVMAYYRHHGNQMTSNRFKILTYHLRVQLEFIEEQAAFIDKLGRKMIMARVWKDLLRQGYDAYWKRDLKTARMAFRRVLSAGQFGVRDIKYLLPSLLPLKLHAALIKRLDGA